MQNSFLDTRQEELGDDVKMEKSKEIARNAGLIKLAFRIRDIKITVSAMEQSLFWNTLTVDEDKTCALVLPDQDLDRTMSPTKDVIYQAKAIALQPSLKKKVDQNTDIDPASKSPALKNLSPNIVSKKVKSTKVMQKTKKKEPKLIETQQGMQELAQDQERMERLQQYDNLISDITSHKFIKPSRF